MMDTKKPIPRHIIIKMPKFKDKEMGGGCGIMSGEVRGLRSTNS